MSCPLCETTNEKSFGIILQESNQAMRQKALQCKKCGLVYLSDYKKDRSNLYNEDYSVWGKQDESFEETVRKSKLKSFQKLLQKTTKFVQEKNPRLLDIGAGKGYLMEAAQSNGFDVFGLELSAYAASVAEKKFPGKIKTGELEKGKFTPNLFDIITMTDVFEHFSDPRAYFSIIKNILKPKGIIVITTPNSNSITRKIFGKNWFHYKDEHVIYWNKQSLNHLCKLFDFRILKYTNNIKWITLSYLIHYSKKYSLRGFNKLFLILDKILPQSLKTTALPITLTGEVFLVLKKQ